MKKTKYVLKIKGISALILSLLVFNICMPYSFAQALFNGVVVTSNIQVLNPEIGSVVEDFIGNTSYKVYCVQDLHCDKEVQNNILKIIGFLKEKHGKDLGVVGVEGSSKIIDTAFLSSIPDQDIKNNIIEELLDDGYLTGPEIYSINNPNQVMLYGLEDKKIYDKDFELLYESFIYREDIDTLFSNVQESIDKVKEFIYKDEIRSFKDMIRKSENGKISFSEYVDLVSLKAYELNINSDQYLEIKKYNNIQRLSKEINSTNAHYEAEEILLSVRSRIDKESLNRLKGLEKESYYLYVKEILSLLNVNYESKYPAFSKYVQYIELKNTLDTIELLEELESLKLDIMEHITKDTGDMSELISFERNMKNFQHYVSNKISHKDIELWNKDKNKFYSQINGIGRRLSREDNIAQYKDIISESDEIMTEFYNLADKRNEIMVSNLLKQIVDQTRDWRPETREEIATPHIRSARNDNKGVIARSVSSTVIARSEATKQSNSLNSQFPIPNSKNSVAVLVVGGYHTPGITQILRNKGISYSVITPKINGDIKLSKKIYERRLKEQGKETRDRRLETGDKNGLESRVESQESPSPLWGEGRGEGSTHNLQNSKLALNSVFENPTDINAAVLQNAISQYLSLIENKTQRKKDVYDKLYKFCTDICKQYEKITGNTISIGYSWDDSSKTGAVTINNAKKDSIISVDIDLIDTNKNAVVVLSKMLKAGSIWMNLFNLTKLLELFTVISFEYKKDTGNEILGDLNNFKLKNKEYENWQVNQIRVKEVILDKEHSTKLRKAFVRTTQNPRTKLISMVISDEYLTALKFMKSRLKKEDYEKLVSELFEYEKIKREELDKGEVKEQGARASKGLSKRWTLRGRMSRKTSNPTLMQSSSSRENVASLAEIKPEDFEKAHEKALDSKDKLYEFFYLLDIFEVEGIGFDNLLGTDGDLMLKAGKVIEEGDMDSAIKASKLFDWLFKNSDKKYLTNEINKLKKIEGGKYFIVASLRQRVLEGKVDEKDFKPLLELLLLQDERIKELFGYKLFEIVLTKESNERDIVYKLLNEEKNQWLIKYFVKGWWLKFEEEDMLIIVIPDLYKNLEDPYLVFDALKEIVEGNQNVVEFKKSVELLMTKEKLTQKDVEEFLKDTFLGYLDKENYGYGYGQSTLNYTKSLPYVYHALEGIQGLVLKFSNTTLLLKLQNLYSETITDNVELGVHVVLARIIDQTTNESLAKQAKAILDDNKGFSRTAKLKVYQTIEKGIRVRLPLANLIRYLAELDEDADEADSLETELTEDEKINMFLKEYLKIQAIDKLELTNIKDDDTLKVKEIVDTITTLKKINDQEISKNMSQIFGLILKVKHGLKIYFDQELDEKEILKLFPEINKKFKAEIISDVVMKEYYINVEGKTYEGIFEELVKRGVAYLEKVGDSNKPRYIKNPNSRIIFVGNLPKTDISNIAQYPRFASIIVDLDKSGYDVSYLINNNTISLLNKDKYLKGFLKLLFKFNMLKRSDISLDGKMITSASDVEHLSDYTYSVNLVTSQGMVVRQVFKSKTENEYFKETVPEFSRVYLVSSPVFTQKSITGLNSVITQLSFDLKNLFIDIPARLAQGKVPKGSAAQITERKIMVMTTIKTIYDKVFESFILTGLVETNKANELIINPKGCKAITQAV